MMSNRTSGKHEVMGAFLTDVYVQSRIQTESFVQVVVKAFFLLCDKET